MQIVAISSMHDASEARAVLRSAGLNILGECVARFAEGPKCHFLVSDGNLAVRALRSNGVDAENVKPPIPVTDSAVRWWKAWRLALDSDTYLTLRRLVHGHVTSKGSIIRIRKREIPSNHTNLQPWSVLADYGVDVRCELHCHPPTGAEIHLLVPDADAATSILESVGFHVTDVDYKGPILESGISWWGEWKPALAFANKIQRPILMSFASPRVENVPGIW